MTVWELREQAVTRVSEGKTRAEWLWCVLRNSETIEAYRNKDQAIARLDELRTSENES